MKEEKKTRKMGIEPRYDEIDVCPSQEKGGFR
jgi:hypothetical protein